MTRFIVNRLIVILTVGSAAYWPIALFTPRQMLLEGIPGFVAAISVGTVVAYFPGAWKALRQRPYTIRGAHLLMLGVTIIQGFIAALFFWAWSYRILGSPIWMTDNIIRGSAVYMLGVGGLLLLLAGDIDEDEALPTRNWLRIGAVIALACGIVVALVLTI